MRKASHFLVLISLLLTFFSFHSFSQIGPAADKAEFKKLVHFDFNSSSPNSDEWSSIEALLVGLDRGIRINVIGHTDDIGSDEANLALAQIRAEAIKELLIKLGFDDSLIQVQSMGETAPIDSNETASGRRNNRRVEISVS